MQLDSAAVTQAMRRVRGLEWQCGPAGDGSDRFSLDTFTHGIAGALLGKAVRGGPGDRAALPLVTVASVFPDTDMLANLFVTDSLVQLELHRGITHSLVALPVFAALLAGGACWITGRRDWWRLTGMAGLGLGLHILLDLVTSFGTMIWTPLSNVRAAWDITFIIDLTLSSIVLVPQLVAWAYKEPERAASRRGKISAGIALMGAATWILVNRAGVELSIYGVAGGLLVMGAVLWLPGWNEIHHRCRTADYCRWGVASLAVYLILCTAAHNVALRRVQQIAEQQQWETIDLAALPAPVSLWHWSGLVRTPDGIYRVQLDLSDEAPRSLEFFANSPPNAYLEESRQLSEVERYLWFARFPWLTYRQEGETHVIEYRDLRFARPSNRGEAPFTFRVLLDHQGTVLSSGLLP